MITAAPATIIGIDTARPITSSNRIAPRDRGDGNDVVEAHDDVGDDDDPYRAPQMRDRFDFGSVGILGHRSSAAM